MALTGINELLDMAKAGTGPDRNIDAMLHSWSLNGIGTGNYADAPKYSESIDAALALVERVLPGTASERTAWRGHYRCALIETNEEGWHNGGKHFRIEATSQASEPLAILAALLSALISKESPS